MGEFPAGAVNRAVSSHRLVDQRPLPVLGADRHQVLQALHQVVGDGDLAAPFRLVPRHLRPEGDDRRVLVEPEVRWPEGEAITDPQPRPEHDPQGHPRRVAGGCGDQCLDLLGGEVVGQGFRFSRPGSASLGGFPQPRLVTEGSRDKGASGRSGEMSSFGNPYFRN